MSRMCEIDKIVSVVLFVCFVSAGCGSSALFDRAGVSGTVTFDGEPIKEGRITFTPQEGESSGAAAALIEDGEYSIDDSVGPKVGKQKVTINASRKTGQTVPAAMPAPEGTMIEVTEEYIPYKYNYATTLSADIKAGDNDGVNFDLKPEPKKSRKRRR